MSSSDRGLPSNEAYRADRNKVKVYASRRSVEVCSWTLLGAGASVGLIMHILFQLTYCKMYMQRPDFQESHTDMLGLTYYAYTFCTLTGQQVSWPKKYMHKSAARGGCLLQLACRSEDRSKKYMHKSAVRGGWFQQLPSGRLEQSLT